MAKYRHRLPQLGGELFLTDGGIETCLIFHEGLDLPHFAAFDLLRTDRGREALRKYFLDYVRIAKERGVGYVLESATWRASPDWAAKLGYTTEALERANREAVAMLHEIRSEHEDERTPMVVSGCIGPRGDGYRPDAQMSAEEAERYHSLQARVFAEADADLVTAITMTYPEEAIGITRAASAAGMPAVISLTVETDGRLPSGHTLADAIAWVDAVTDDGPAYYMINCAHPTHFRHALDAGEPWIARIRGLRANASTKSHAELDEAEVLDEGDPLDLGERYRELRSVLTRLNVLGGCCGTDHRHVAAACAAWTD